MWRHKRVAYQTQISLKKKSPTHKNNLILNWIKRRRRSKQYSHLSEVLKTLPSRNCHLIVLLSIWVASVAITEYWSASTCFTNFVSFNLILHRNKILYSGHGEHSPIKHSIFSHWKFLILIHVFNCLKCEIRRVIGERKRKDYPVLAKESRRLNL